MNNLKKILFTQLSVPEHIQIYIAGFLHAALVILLPVGFAPVVGAIFGILFINGIFYIAFGGVLVQNITLWILYLTSLWCAGHLMQSFRLLPFTYTSLLVSTFCALFVGTLISYVLLKESLEGHFSQEVSLLELVVALSYSCIFVFHYYVTLHIMRTRTDTKKILTERVQSRDLFL
jgi:hypothetical protein